METYIFDGTLQGLLTAVFDFYELKPANVKLVSEKNYQPTLLGTEHLVTSGEEKALRVWNGFEKKAGKTWLITFYTAFLSEQPEAYQDLFNLMRYVFDNPPGAIANFGNPSVLAVSQMARKVSRERHRMKAFIRFQETTDGIFYAAIEPDFNVLPLIAEFFKNRYACQRWLIYDLKRNYGLFYDLNEVEEVVLDELPSQSPYLEKEMSSAREDLYQLLWTDYFKSTNIQARKNTKLHLRHVPRRYWKYLTEKRIL